MPTSPPTTAENAAPALERSLKSIEATLTVVLQQYENQTLVQSAAAAPGGEMRVALAGGAWSIEAPVRPSADADGAKLDLRAELREGSVEQVAFGVEIQLADWSREHYLLMPAAVYAGNRFSVHATHRMEGLPELGPTPQIIMGPNVPRLNIHDGPSRVQMLSGDLSFPAIAIHFPTLQRGLIVTTVATTPIGYTSLALFENDDRTAATIRILAPGVREGGRYNGRPCNDRAADWRAGDRVELPIEFQAFDAPDMQAVYDRLFDIRATMRLPRRTHHEIPFSEVWRIQERKFNEQNWVEKYGYYSVGMRESRPQDWQSGWVGGPNILPALLGAGDATTFRRALRTFDFLCDGALTASGFLRGSFHEGVWSDNPRTLLRYSGDSLYCLLQSFAILRHRNEPIHAPWERLVRSLAEGFVRLWERYGQFGHHVRAHRDELAIGGTCTAALAIGGLARASEWFKDHRYLDVAIAAATYYNEQFIARGITNGGPGDIIQAPDSESCFGLLDSYVTLYEITLDDRWLQVARQVAHQAATWVVNYDFPFPPGSTFAKLGMLTDGTVYANVQNKHSAPGICTLSGDSLLKLFRATGDRRYLDLLRSIAHAIPQYMSREDRPIIDRRPNQRWPIMPAGWINERVNMSDWEVRNDPTEEIGVGEIFGGSTWSEGAMLLTYAELPGIYAQPDTRLLCVFDHVTAEWTGPNEISVTNLTKFDATVKVMVESSHAASTTRLADGLNAALWSIAVGSGGSAQVRLTLT